MPAYFNTTSLSAFVDRNYTLFMCSSTNFADDSFQYVCGPQPCHHLTINRRHIQCNIYVSSLGRHAAYDPRRLLVPRATMRLCTHVQSHLLHLIGLSYLYFLCTAVRPMINYPHSRLVFYFDFPPPRTWLAHGCTISSSSGIPSARVLFPSFVLVWVKHNAAASHQLVLHR